jgi:hypothetical protein
VASVTNVTKVPNVALRFHPAIAPDELRALYNKYGIKTDASTPPVGDAPLKSDSRPRATDAEQGVVWKLHPDNSLEPVRIALGITDHATTQAIAVLGGTLGVGDDVITGVARTK